MFQFDELLVIEVLQAVPDDIGIPEAGKMLTVQLGSVGRQSGSRVSPGV